MFWEIFLGSWELGCGVEEFLTLLRLGALHILKCYTCP